MINQITIRPACVNMYVLGLWINYGTINWERGYVTLRGLQAHSSSESSFTEETHLQSI